MSISPQQIVIVLLLAAVVALAIGMLFRRDTAQEERRRGYIVLSKAFDALGLSRLADVAENAAIGDYSGLYREGKALAKDLSSPEKMMALLAESFYKQLPERLKRDGDREQIFKAVSEAKSALSKPPSVA